MMAGTIEVYDNPSIEHLPDRVKLNRNYDVQRLKNDVTTITSSLRQQSYIYYMPVMLAKDVRDPVNHNWLAEHMLEGCPYLQSILSEFKAPIVSVRLMRLEPGAELKEHTDPTLDAVHKEVVRLTLPIFSFEEALFLLNGTRVDMQPGELWYLKLSEKHSVHNNSTVERINMSIDLEWNSWVEELLISGFDTLT
ncbi:aspartyl/asparaginyl beta-hydroxylase domain-containing protein [Marinomonas mediterranea]|jgi:Aspartyl/Asparaginyl beta-hydroxylase.|uniref:Aspartyl/Asparaginyl beta-hydroxylase n=1 Tax=Marinomonas mediterranea (strain ATCC 700492 / JCM 21426 / NBRC 103028 / MMB-1) TaxID=717774 RepID=F2JV46_MARM1|nr:aspartyl/asparaginyl beta-hydroxylase domain-containing protein [Marinomonas mediterranea]ADZ92804.1 Aspartyl/Asparaginyl beta-hydroxylase [Marinomonas mediterranea MMB-1]WCN18827.1 hypothetical protein GV053_18165 [Marinomonas mediterranea MMB-1]